MVLQYNNDAHVCLLLVSVITYLLSRKVKMLQSSTSRVAFMAANIGSNCWYFFKSSIFSVLLKLVRYGKMGNIYTKLKFLYCYSKNINRR